MKNPILIQVRGTGGSGKTTVVRKTMKLLGETWEKKYVSYKKKPAYLKHSSGVVVLGHYDGKVANGCDTLGISARALLVLDYVLKTEQPVAVLFEGLFLSEDVKRTASLPNLTAIYLDTKLERCLKQIAVRNEQVGNLRPINTAARISSYHRVARTRSKLEERGVTCLTVDPNDAPKLILRLINEHSL